MLLLDLLAPPRCAVCAEPGCDLCAACRRGLLFLPAARCGACGLPADPAAVAAAGPPGPSDGPPSCGPRCPAARQSFERSWAAVEYAGTAPAVVAALKFRGRIAVARTMAAQMLPGMGLLATPQAVLVPVPTSAARERSRGYDQARLLARVLSRRAGLPVADLLERPGAEGAAGQAADRRAQHRRSRRDRLSAAGLVRARTVAPPHCVLVDDVHTTGATLDHCARALREAGAMRVDAVSWARTTRRP